MNKRTFWFTFLLVLALAAFLRIYRLTHLPPSLYWEEVALGYDAYSIMETGKDHHGNSFPIVAFESFGDWKPSLYFYTIVPFIKLFGLHAWAVRLPAALSGIATVIGVGVLAKLLTVNSKHKKRTQLIAMAVTAISPWAIQFSRAGWEVTLATALLLWGVVLFLIGLDTKKKQLGWLIGSVVLLVLSMYTYHATRIIAPLIGMGLSLLWLTRPGAKNWKQIVVVAVCAVIMLVPLLSNLTSKATTQRFAETSIFSDMAIIEESNARKEQAGNSPIARIVYHRYVLFSREILINALSHFHPNFLFVSGDANPRHSVQYVGQLYHIEIVLLLLGLVYVGLHWNVTTAFLCAWLIIGLIPAAMTKATPHALRILPTLPVFMILISFGIVQLYQWLGKKVMVLLVCVYIAELAVFWHFYSSVYPKKYADHWQYGYQEMIQTVNEMRQKYPELPVYITREQGRPAMYYWFFTQTDPRLAQSAEVTAKQDQGELLEFENIHFINSTAEVIGDEALVASSPDQALPSKEILKEIHDPTGKVVWLIYKAHTL